ncbi:MAG: hypothetical protein IKX53_03015 [Bacteroidales bacterium]|nr:hypothetical protein [Bacteroidales bacterium]
MFKKLRKKKDDLRKRREWAESLAVLTGVPWEQIAADQSTLWRDHLITRDEYAEFRLCSAPKELHDNFLGLHEQRPYLDYLNPKSYYILSRNKFVAHQIFSALGIPHAELICCYQPEGVALDQSYVCNDIAGVLQSLLRNASSPFVIKDPEGAHGHDVWLFDSVDVGPADAVLKSHDGREVQLSALLGTRPLLFERAVRQSEQFASFNPSSVNTIRFMTTLYPDNSVRILAAFIKIGRKGSCVDNAGDGGNVDACIDVETGQIQFALQYDGLDRIKEIDRHPDTGTLLKGTFVDDWPSIKSCVCRFQQAFPFCKAPGWDIAITHEGPVVIEVNDFWDRTGQVFIRRGWRKEIRDCWLAWKATGKEWVFGRDYERLVPIARINEIINSQP